MDREARQYYFFFFISKEVCQCYAEPNEYMQENLLKFCYLMVVSLWSYSKMMLMKSFEKKKTFYHVLHASISISQLGITRKWNFSECTWASIQHDQITTHNEVYFNLAFNFLETNFLAIPYKKYSLIDINHNISWESCWFHQLKREKKNNSKYWEVKLSTAVLESNL